MTRLTRIEKSAFRKGEYVGYAGYAGGVWSVRKTDGGWCARRRVEHGGGLVTARTLAGLDAKLTQFAEGA